MAVTSQVYFASDERWYVQYVSRIGEVERQWTEGPYAGVGWRGSIKHAGTVCPTK
jgi:hypothetical protein